VSTTKIRKKIIVEIDIVKHKIDAAYWTFSRTARGKPPCLVVPDEYARQHRLWDLLRELHGIEKTIAVAHLAYGRRWRLIIPGTYERLRELETEFCPR